MNKFNFVILMALSFFISETLKAQLPVLGTASGFVFFTSVGMFANTGSTTVHGNIGTNAGLLTGFLPGIVNGQIHIADPVSVQAAIDVQTAYSSLAGLTCNTVLGTSLGNSQVITQGIYCTGAASTINGELVLDAQGDSDAVFIFQIDGALSTGISSQIVLANSASFENVYWQVNGAVTLGDFSTFRGNIVANGAITLLDQSTLHGRALCRNGAINLHNIRATRYLSALNLKLFIEGYYTGGGFMVPVLLNQGVAGVTSSITDTIIIELRKPVAPYNVMASVKTLLHTDGTASGNFPVLGNAYIAIKHRNGLQTWSANVENFGSVALSYDFSTSVQKAFGSNQSYSDGRATFFSGDLNQDENMDIVDLEILETDLGNYEYGYKVTDLNGDGNVDLLDISILEFNTNQFIYSHHL